MDPATIDAIKTLGFPTVVAAVLGSILYGMLKWFQKTGDELKGRLFVHLDACDKSLGEIKPALDALQKTGDRTLDIVSRTGPPLPRTAAS